MLDWIRQRWFSLVLVGYAVYACAFIYNSSVVVGGERYFMLLDDPMISMTYARNLASGHGAVWYPGVDPVEGYSNPLWMLYMALIHLLPLPSSWMSLPIQLTGAASIGGTLFFVKRIVEELMVDVAKSATIDKLQVQASKGKPTTTTATTTLQSTMMLPTTTVSTMTLRASMVAVLLTGFYLPLNNWTLRGMEVGAVVFGMSAAVWAALRWYHGEQRAKWLFPLLGLLTTVRMDAAVVGVALLLWLGWAIPKCRRQTLLEGFGWLAFFLAAQMGIQKAYYHDWLPNTYYLKLNSAPLGQRLVWGLYVLYSSLAGIGLWLSALILALLVVVRSKTMGLLSVVIIAQIAYILYVGGDAWEWWGGADRYLCTVLPLFFILASIALAIFFAALPSISSVFNAKRESYAFWGLALITIVQVNSYQFTSSCSLAQWLLADVPIEVNEHAKMLRLARLLRENTTPDARIAVVWAGVIPYFSERQAVDLLGKNDRTVAKGPNRPYENPPLMFFASSPVPYCWPGHTKRDYPYSIGQLSPDVIAQQWYDMSTIGEMLGRQYVDVPTEEGDVFVKKTTANTTGLLAPYMDLGNALAQKGKLDEAAAMYQKALDFGFGVPMAHNNLGLLAAKRGHTEDAIAHYQKSLEAKPDFFEALVNLAGVYAARGQYDEALSYFQKALAADPNHAKTRTECDRIKALQEQARQSLAKQRELLRSKPTDVALLSSIAWTLATHPDRTIRNGAEAVPLAEQAVELSQSKDPIVLGTLAAAYAEAGRFPDAASTARKALEIASQQNKPALVDAIKAKISLYESNAAFRDFQK